MNDSNPYDVREAIQHDSVVTNPWCIFLTVIAQTVCICLAPTPVLIGILAANDSIAQPSISKAPIELLALPLALFISGVVAFFIYRNGNRVAPILGLGIWLVITLATGVRFLSA
jgi:hypothetical protein